MYTCTTDLSPHNFDPEEATCTKRHEVFNNPLMTAHYCYVNYVCSGRLAKVRLGRDPRFSVAEGLHILFIAMVLDWTGVYCEAHRL